MSATKTDRRAPAAVTTGAAEVPVLITEGQVRMGTTAVLGAPGRHRTVWRALVAAVLGRRRPRRQRRHYPPRYVFLEHAAMAREMQRL